MLLHFLGSSMPLFGSLMAASKSPDKVASGEPATQGILHPPGKFSFTAPTVSSSASAGSLSFMGESTASPSSVPVTQSSSVPGTFAGFGSKPQVPGSSGSFSFTKPAFGTPPTTAASETPGGASPFTSFTGFGSSGLASFGGLGSQPENSDKGTSVSLPTYLYKK